jgi:hypothetical protein
MIPFAAALFAIVLWYLGKVWQDVELVGVDATRRARTPIATKRPAS